MKQSLCHLGCPCASAGPHPSGPTISCDFFTVTVTVRAQRHPQTTPFRLPLCHSSPGQGLLVLHWVAGDPSPHCFWPRCPEHLRESSFPLLSPLQTSSVHLRFRFLKKMFLLFLLPCFFLSAILQPAKLPECGKGNRNIQGEDRTSVRLSNSHPARNGCIPCNLTMSSVIILWRRKLGLNEVTYLMCPSHVHTQTTS